MEMQGGKERKRKHRDRGGGAAGFVGAAASFAILGWHVVGARASDAAVKVAQPARVLSARPNSGGSRALYVWEFSDWGDRAFFPS